jgi:uncharacterized protein (DUF1499 family)
MISALKKLGLTLIAIMAIAGAAAAIEIVGGQPMGLFAGSRPASLGFNSGKFTPPSWKPNCVSSTVEKSDKHYIDPLAFSGDANAAWAKLVGLVKGQTRVSMVSEKPGYLYVEAKSAGLGFVDDVEFALDEKASVIHLRSASRLGVRDFDVNRKRVEAIRAAFGK